MMNEYARKIALCDPLRESMMRAAIETLRLPEGSRGLDAGCGIGSHVGLLADAVGPSGKVVGVDQSSELIRIARDRSTMSDVSDQLAFKEGNLNRLPFEDDSFDWVWSVDCAGYPIAAGPAVIRKLSRVTRPGGTVAILVWSSQMLLPGHPRLEARLNATLQGIAPFEHGIDPTLHVLRALGWFRGAGMQEVCARTFAGSVYAPLSEVSREAIASLAEMRWGGSDLELSDEDRAEYRRLCDSNSPDFVADAPDYYAFFTYSMFSGKKPLKA